MTNPAVDEVPMAFVVHTIQARDVASLLTLLPTEHALAWMHGTDGIIGWGQAATFRATGPDRFLEADRWWQGIAARANVEDTIRCPGTGLLAFGTFTFSDDVDGSMLVVPEVIVGRRGATAWVTTISTTAIGRPQLHDTTPPAPPTQATFRDGSIDGVTWQQTIAEGVRRINSGALDKVVLARDIYADLEEPLDVRWPLAQLATTYPNCWTFHIDGFFGATPEMLVRLERGLITSRILAGTIQRTGDDTHDLALAGSLARSSKDLEEHEYAVRSVADALAPHCTSMNVPEAPYVLHLPNVMHLATDVTGVIDDDATALTLAAALHPSAAVGGTPTDVAVRLIAELEQMSRDRYAGPVGWIDASGDGEWGIGLRSAQIQDDGTRVRLFAGCGIVADSVPVDELSESNAKLIPVRDALMPPA